MRASTLIAAFTVHAPAILAGVQTALAAAVPEDSIDYAVMEKARNVSVVRFEGAWSDLASWESVWQDSPRDEAGNALSTHATSFQCENSLLRSESEDIELVGIGLKNIVAIAMRDAVMVADVSDAQNVKQAEQFPKDHRPWGWYETLVLADRFQVKRIHVHPGAALSLQSHVHRSEHWIVVAGTAKVTVDDRVQLLTENQSVYIPLGRYIVWKTPVVCRWC